MGCFRGILSFMTQIFNRRDQTAKRQLLRRSTPEAETLLRERLRGKQIDNAKFRRQVSVGPYVLDFYCPALTLAVEVDGPTHNGGDTPDCDAARHAYVEPVRVAFLRFRNAEVYSHLDSVVERIAARARELAGKELHSPAPSLSPAGSASAEKGREVRVFFGLLPFLKGEGWEGVRRGFTQHYM